MSPAAAALAELRAQAARCPSDPTTASFHHAAAKRDAATGEPTTAEGRSLLKTARTFDEGRVIGECICGSSFVWTPDPARAELAKTG